MQKTGLTCEVVAVGKRRDGGTRYWCLEHKADATAKYGVQADKCKLAHLEPVTKDQTLELNINDYPGGVGIWGAVPPIYDTTQQPMDKGIHVHARQDQGGFKDIDETYRKVIVSKGACSVAIEELDAIYYMVSSVFGHAVRIVHCNRCGHQHLDKDWFSVHPHKKHLCAGCGKTFSDIEVGVGNPVAGLHRDFSVPLPSMKRSSERLDISQRLFPRGIKIWASNPALLWTAKCDQEEGIHVHCYTDDSLIPVVDETFGEVVIDGISIDERQARNLMGQLALPHLLGRITVLKCEKCRVIANDLAIDAYSPRSLRNCGDCSSPLKPSGRMRKVVSNPIVGTLERLATFSKNPVQSHDLGLIPETI